MEIIKNNKNNEKILFSCFMYNNKLKRVNFIFVGNVESIVHLNVLLFYLLLWNISSIKAAKIDNKIKERSKLYKNTPNQIITETLSSLLKNILINMPKEDTIKSLIRNQRRESNLRIVNHLSKFKN